MKNRFILVILFLFISPALFAARELRKRQAKEDSAKLIDYKKEFHIAQSQQKEKLHITQLQKKEKLYTQQLEKLFRDYANSSQFRNSINRWKMKNLIGKGANVDEVDTGLFSYEPFFSYMCNHGHFGIVRSCISNGASPEVPDENGKTPVFFCKTISLLKFLKKNGADLSHRDGGGRTPFINAIDQEYSADVIELLSRHIAPSFRDPIHIPLYYGCKKDQDDNFELRAAVLLWCSKFQFNNEDGNKKELAADWLRKRHSSTPNFPIYEVINKNIERAYEKCQHEESENVQHAIGKFFSDNHNITNLVRDYSGPSPVSYIPLRDLMKRKGSKEKYPAVAPLFYTKGIFSRLIS